MLNQSGQRILEVLVFSASESMACHHDVLAENIVLLIEASHSLAFGRRKKAANDGTALRVKILLHAFPIDGTDAIRILFMCATISAIALCPASPHGICTGLFFWSA